MSTKEIEQLAGNIISGLMANKVLESNNKTTRNDIKRQVEAVLTGFQKLNHIHDYTVECNEKNNPPDVINRHELVLGLAVKYFRDNEDWTAWQHMATRTDVNFEDVLEDDKV